MKTTKTKTIKITIGILLFVINAMGQDVIYLKNGKTINAQVIEVDGSDVKYRKFQSEDGRLYILNKGDLKGIRYQNGTADKFENKVADKNKPDQNIPTGIKGQLVATVGYGGGLFLDARGYNCMADYGLAKKFSLGLAYTHGTSLSVDDQISGFIGFFGTGGMLTRDNIGIRALFHFGKLKNIDFYGGPRVGLSFFSNGNNPIAPSNTVTSSNISETSNTVAPSIQGLMGARFYIDNNFGFNFEAAIGSPYMASIGANYKF